VNIDSDYMTDEKIFTIPLRKAWRSSRNKRANKAIIIIHDFLKRHMKGDVVKIGQGINEEVWKSSRQNPPRRIRVHAIKENDIVYAEILGKEIKKASKEELTKKQEKKKAKLEKIKEERKERRKMSIKEEIEQEEGKKVEVKERPSEVPETKPKQEEEREQEIAKEDRKI